MPIISAGALSEAVIVDSAGTAISTIDPGDGLTEPSLELAVGIQNYLYNGSTLDRSRSGAASGLLIGAQKVVNISSVTNLQSYTQGNDKTFTISSNKCFLVHSAFLRIICDATSGNRQVQCNISDGSEDIGNFVYTMAMTAGNTYFWTLTPYLNYTSMATENRAFGGIPPGLVLRESQYFRILDANDVSSSDTWAVNVQGTQWDE